MMAFFLLYIEQFTLRPYAHLGLDRSGIPSSVTPSEIIDELLTEIPEIVDAAQCVSQFWHGSRETEEITSLQDSKVFVEEPWLRI